MNQTSCLKISCNASKRCPGRAPALSAEQRLHPACRGAGRRGCTLQARSPHHHPGTDRPADRVPDGNGALIAGQSWTDTGEHHFALEAGPLRLRRAFCGVEQEGESFLLRVNALSRNNALPADADAEAELEALCADTVRRCWTLGLDISGLGAHRALRDGHFALINKTSARKFGQT